MKKKKQPKHSPSVHLSLMYLHTISKCAYFRWRFVIPQQSSIIFFPVLSHQFPSHASTEPKKRYTKKETKEPVIFRWTKVWNLFGRIVCVRLNRKSIIRIYVVIVCRIAFKCDQTNALFVLHLKLNEPNKFSNPDDLLCVIHTWIWNQFSNISRFLSC